MQNKETILRLLVIALLLYMLTSYAAARGRLAALREREEEMDRLCVCLRAENEELQQRLASAGDDETLEALARERLGLVMPGERIYYFD